MWPLCRRTLCDNDDEEQNDEINSLYFIYIHHVTIKTKAFLRVNHTIMSYFCPSTTTQLITRIEFQCNFFNAQKLCEYFFFSNQLNVNFFYYMIVLTLTQFFPRKYSSGRTTHTISYYQQQRNWIIQEKFITTQCLGQFIICWSNYTSNSICNR